MTSPSTMPMTADPTLSPSAGAVASTAADVSRLIRPRIAVMVLATVATAAWLTAGQSLNGAALAVVLLGTLLVAASSSIANQIVERDTDRLMPRTAARPLVTGRMGVRDAWILSAGLLVAGLVITVAGGGWAASAASLSTWLLYVLVYTPLKRVTPLNTAVGAIAGALPWRSDGVPPAVRGDSWQGTPPAGSPPGRWQRSFTSGSSPTSWRSPGSTAGSIPMPVLRCSPLSIRGASEQRAKLWRRRSPWCR